MTTVMADGREQAIGKAALLAERLGIGVGLVEPVENLPMVAKPTENEGRVRETDCQSARERDPLDAACAGGA